MKKKLKMSGELEAEIARKQLQTKRYHQKVKGSGYIYNRQKSKKIKEYTNENEQIH